MSDRPGVTEPPRQRAPAFIQALLFYNRPVFTLLRLRAKKGPCFQLREPAVNGAEWAVWICDPALIAELLAAGPDVVERPDHEHGAVWHGGGEPAGPWLDELFESGDDWTSAAAAATRRRIATWRPDRPVPLYEELRPIAVEVLFGHLAGVGDPADFERIEELLADRTVRNIPIFPDWRYSSNPRRMERARERYAEVAELLTGVEPELRPAVTAALAHAFDAVTALGGWVLERLLRHQAALDSLRADLADGSQRYLDAVLLETLHVRPIVLALGRRLVSDRDVAGYRLRAGTLLRLAVGLAHLPPEVTARPETFEPERWLEAADARPPALAYGTGPARCPGQGWSLALTAAIVREIVLGVELERVIDPEELSRFRRPHRMLTPSNKARAIVTPKVARGDRPAVSEERTLA